MKANQPRLAGVKGMNDILPADEGLWHHLEQELQWLASAYGYRQIRTPIVESTELFVRGIGEVTDIVEKEMYSFTDSLNGERLTLRPENTAAVVRSTIEHNLLYDGPKRLWYVGPMFRHERPQRGRYRQFHQFGVEALGFAGPDIDAEVILMGRRLWESLGLEKIRLEINSLGQRDERLAHRNALIDYFSAHLDLLDEEARKRLHANPLRILDTKNPAMQELAQNAPRLIDHLGSDSLAHFDGLQQRLNDAGVPYVVNPRLVRGLDYYNLTVFEWITDSLGSQGTVCGGGRYDPLIEQMGGKAAPACGFAMGLERLVDLMRQSDQKVAVTVPDIYLLHQSDAGRRVGMRVAEGLRDVGYDVILHCDASAPSSLKSQMKRADASGARYAVILGEDELKDGQASVKDLRNNGTQQRVGLDALPDFFADASVAEEGED